MSLQKQYGAVLLLLLLLFAGFIAGMLVFIRDRQYLLAAMLAVILYLASYLIGKRISLLFLELSLLKFIRKNNGQRQMNDCSFFLRSQYRKGVSDTDFQKVLSQIYTDLEKKGYITIVDQSIRLLQ